jgi:hypothetical protein
MLYDDALESLRVMIATAIAGTPDDVADAFNLLETLSPADRGQLWGWLKARHPLLAERMKRARSRVTTA